MPDVPTFATTFATRLANRALQREDALRARLAAHSGAVFSVAAGAAKAVFCIDDAGALAPAAEDALPSLALTIRPLDVAALLHDPARFDEWVHADGDAALAATLRELCVTLPWFVEQMFGDLFGALLGQRLADAGRQLLGLPGHVATRVSASVASYVREEANIAMGADDVRGFGDDIARVDARADALAGRIDTLEAHRR